MNYELFDKKYVYFDFNDVSKLKGKYGFGSDTFNDLIWKVNENSRTNSWFPCMYSTDTSRPFHLQTGENVRFFYYDPFYELKLAFKKGEKLQYKYRNWRNSAFHEEVWYDYEENTMPHFDGSDAIFDWRVKPTETWWVIFAEDTFLRVSMITNLSNFVFFSGKYEECGKWIDEHKVYVEILSAWKHGKTIQCKPNGCDFWSDWILNKCPNINSLERCDWRIKPTEEIINYTNETSREPFYILNMHKKDRSEFEFTMSEHDSFSPIYANTRKKCQHVLNTIVAEFTDKCVGCKGNSCFKCKPLQDFIKNIKFTRRMTNRELAEYLAKGNGEMKNSKFVIINTSTCFNYMNGAENENVDDYIYIRDFGSDEWRQPLIEV